MKIENGILEKPYLLFYRQDVKDCFTGSIPCEFREIYNATEAFKSIMDNGYFIDETGRRIAAFSGFLTMAMTPVIIESGESFEL